ncbi:endoplasmic reticulum protein [Amanita rubescens]|nr:endoplasmic reticulum protein [Amanita rubescens]
MVFNLKHQPLKSIYLTYQILSTLFIRIPWWTLQSTFRSWRPRESWSLTRALLVRLIRHVGIVMKHVGGIAPRTSYKAIQPGPGVNGIWVDPVPNLIIGDVKAYAETGCEANDIYEVIVACDGIEQSRRERIDRRRRLSRGKTILERKNAMYRFHGLQESAEYISFSPACGGEATSTLDPSLWIQYPGNRYLVENQTSSEVKLPAPPGGILLLSPWTDLSDSNDQPGSSMFRNDRTDYLDAGQLVVQAKTFLGPHGSGASETNRYVSPACKHPSFDINFVGFPRTFIIVGDAEMLLDQIKTLHQRMVKDLGPGDGVGENEGKVRYLEAPDAVHDFLVFENFEPERSSTLKEIADWIAAWS